MIDVLDTLKELDYNKAEDATLLKLENDIFDTAVLVYHRDSPDEEVYVLDNMQGEYPETFEDVPFFNWNRIEDVDW